jgi:lipopolysaccharide biosynthesis glycosyltransferase
MDRCLLQNAVCYVADLNFMLPSLISAAQVRRFVPARDAKIYIFAIGTDDVTTSRIKDFVKPLDLEIVHVDSTLFAGVDWSRADKKGIPHVPITALGRFFIAELLPQTCRNILYLDGDTWINQNPAPLVHAKLPDGKLAAVEDDVFFCKNDLTPNGQFVRSYFQGIGINAAKGYFNSGVLAATRNAWRTIAGEALEFFKKNTEVCTFYDQSAMNAVVGERRIRLSLAWNFQTPYRYWHIEEEISPIIYHFSQALKPWTGPVEPWAEIFPLYEKQAAAFAALALPSVRLSGQEIATASALARRTRRKLYFVYPWRLWLRRRMARQLSFSEIADLETRADPAY